MLRPEEIIERSDKGMIVDVVVMPPGWTERDANVIGQPVVLGTRDTGYIGVIVHKDGNPVQIWWSEETRPTVESAREDVIAEAQKRKKHVAG